MEDRNRPIVTGALAALCLVVFLRETTLDAYAREDLLTRWGVTPAYLIHDPTPHELLTLLTAPFLHGGAVHLLASVAFLWLFGRAVERALGPGRYLGLWVACGAATALAEAAVLPLSILPIVGASGAVAGILGAHVALRPAVPIYPAAWLALQGLAALTSPGVDVAWFAHVGGFAAGALLAGLALDFLGRVRSPEPVL